MPFKTANRLDFSNLSYKTGEQTLLNFFANYGRIEKLILYKDDQDQSLREGFVIYTELNSINQLMSQRPHSIDQRTVFLQRHIPSSLSSMKSSCMSDYLGAHLTVNEIFISRLCWGESRETFVNYFQRFGTIRHCRVFNTASRNPKQMGYAFVSFDDYDSVGKFFSLSVVEQGKRVTLTSDQVILSRPHVIHSRFYQVRKCIPREYNYIVSSIKPLSFNQPIWQHYAFGLINMHTQTITYPSRPHCVTRPTSLME